MSFTNKILMLIALLLAPNFCFSGEQYQRIYSDTAFENSEILQKVPKHVILVNEKFVSSFSDYVPMSRISVASEQIKSSSQSGNTSNSSLSREDKDQLTVSRTQLNEIPYDEFFIELEYVLSECGTTIVDTELAIRKKFNELKLLNKEENDYALLLTQILEENANYIIEVFPRFNLDNQVELVDLMIRNVSQASKKRLRVKPKVRVNTEERFVASSKGFVKETLTEETYSSGVWLAREAAVKLCNL